MQQLIPKIRAMLHVSQQELADMIGVSFATVNQSMGKRTLPPE